MIVDEKELKQKILKSLKKEKTVESLKESIFLISYYITVKKSNKEIKDAFDLIDNIN